jgi:hypothetical protein
LKQAAEIIINAARTPEPEKPIPKPARARKASLSDAPLKLVWRFYLFVFRGRFPRPPAVSFMTVKSGFRVRTLADRPLRE